MKDVNKLWFQLPDVWSLCRAGGNGPRHPSQLYAIKKYVKPHMSFLDIGCGSGTTYEAMKTAGISVVYKGIDMIPKNVAYCKKLFPEGDFEVQDAENLDECDKSWDVAYSRHVVDHMPSFEIGLSEHCRVAKQLVIIVLWRPLSDYPEHKIKNIVQDGKVYEHEYTNDYSRKMVMDALQSHVSWDTVEVAEDVGSEVRGHDVVIVLRRKYT